MATDTASQQTPGSRIMTFHPTKEEFKDFSRYIAYMESQGAHRAGMAKVIPPKDWKPRRTYDDIDDLVIPAPIQQVVTGQSGLFTQYNIQKKPMTVREFRKTANTDKFCNPRYVDFEELERKFWKNLTFNPPLYGADINGTLYDPDVTEWNIGHLNTILDTVERESGIKIKGVNTPYLYFGMWKSTFAWHTEDMDLYSINYLHFGEPKSWYVVPPEHGKRLERLAKGFFPGSAQSCEAFLRHKMTLISPSILKKYGIPFEKITQEAGQFIVTFPFGYHAGFNHGFNCAESTNFATQRWIDYGKIATLCSCRKDMVKISMDVFVRKFQPDRYKAWKAGKDNTPIDHSRPTPEAADFLKTGEPGKEGPSRSEAPDQENTPCTTTQEEKSPKVGKKRQRGGDVEAAEDGDTEQVDEEEEEEEGEVDQKKAKLGQEEKGHSLAHKELKAEDVKNERTKPPLNTKTNRNTNASRKLALQMKAKVSLKSTQPQTTSQSTQPAAPEPSPQSSEKAGPSEDVKPPASSSSPSHPASSSSPSHPASSSSPVHRLFQRTLSPADVLHVHSYAKGDYSEGETREGKEERRNDSSDSEGEEQDDSKRAEEGEDDGAVPRKLGTLPCHQRLMKDDMSDEELPEQPPVDEDGLEGESWAKPLAHLWQNRPPNLKKEKEYNRCMGLQAPYCSVCSLFQAFQQTECADDGTDPPVVLPGGRLRTKPLIPEMCFTTTTEPEEGAEEKEPGPPAPTTPHLEPDGTSLLISCSHCSVRVHTSCYGVDPESVTKDWKCARCKANSMTESCCLCLLRGGALQKANNNKWVHVLCAVAVLEARFVNITERSPVDLSGIPLQRFKLKCYYCKKRMKKTSGCCVQCSHGRCPTAYHPTCAQAAGILMQPDEWPFVVYVTCCRHKGPIQTERNKAAMHELTVGRRVICKHKNGRYYQCDVVQLSKETFYEVNFDDGSFSDNLFPEDIVGRDCAQIGPPPQGEMVQVRWTDGLVYGAKFVAAHIIQMYQVEFEDGSQLTAKRDDVYTLDEELPKKVKSRLSKASDMRFDGIFEDKEAIQQSKRQRVINSRYRGDYVEPVIYRAIME
ncbi:LOW QUALITY PROTEIN: lysine-specific demethylase 4A [Salmo salar]|uniref:[histone H3]-trimethyl-L-lysine(9) demethylase n=1 Tax=Salmo salar TaxID=8030 RepID=A0A1S3KJ87_SALSA|nr:LOW QUALITY PROTEIN: lysine-specific demethylase 4A [Salmo salar]|eukprot:XP_013978647.1 PREDICTED: lysine-specific demethylase 4A [Salmo salar]